MNEELDAAEVFQKGLNTAMVALAKLVQDKSRVFDETVTLEPGETQTRTWMEFKPLEKNQGSASFTFNQSSKKYAKGRQPNEVFLMGWNTTPGGGQLNPGEPGLAISMEQHYKPENDGLGATELHFFWITPAGNQIRILSYTINNAISDVDFYQTIDRIKLKLPSTMEEYFRVSSGAGLKNTQVMINGEDAVIQLGSIVMQAVTAWKALTISRGLYVNGMDTWGTGLYVKSPAKFDAAVTVQGMDIVNEIKSLKERIAVLEKMRPG